MSDALEVRHRRVTASIQPPSSAFAGFRFPPEVILLAVRWYLRYGLSYRDLEELLTERGIEVDHVTLFRWVQRFTPLLVGRGSAVSPQRRWSLVRRRDLREGLRILALRLPGRRPIRAGHRRVLVEEARPEGGHEAFFADAIRSHGEPAEVTTDRAHALVRVVAELLPAALHDTTQYANNRVEADHGRLKARLRPMRGLKRDRTASVVIRGHAFIQNLRRGHYELGIDARPGSPLLQRSTNSSG